MNIIDREVDEVPKFLSERKFLLNAETLEYVKADASIDGQWTGVDIAFWNA